MNQGALLLLLGIAAVAAAASSSSSNDTPDPENLRIFEVGFACTSIKWAPLGKERLQYGEDLDWAGATVPGVADAFPAAGSHEIAVILLDNVVPQCMGRWPPSGADLAGGFGEVWADVVWLVRYYFSLIGRADPDYPVEDPGVGTATLPGSPQPTPDPKIPNPPQNPLADVPGKPDVQADP